VCSRRHDHLDDVKIDALALSTGNIMPGDSITDDVVVENDGTSQLVRPDRATAETSSPNAAHCPMR